MKLYYLLFALVTLLCQMGTVHPGPENEEPPTEPGIANGPDPDTQDPEEPPTEPERPEEPTLDSSEAEPGPKEEPPTEPGPPEVPEPPKTCTELGGHCDEDCHPKHILAGTGCPRDETCCKHD